MIRSDWKGKAEIEACLGRRIKDPTEMACPSGLDISDNHGRLVYLTADQALFGRDIGRW